MQETRCKSSDAADWSLAQRECRKVLDLDLNPFSRLTQFVIRNTYDLRKGR